MTHRSNGKHRYPASESIARFKPEMVSGQRARSDFESGIAHAHDQIVETATQFIRDRPGASLMLAAALGGLIGWLIKRRS